LPNAAGQSARSYDTRQSGFDWFEHGYAAIRACIARNVVGDFRCLSLRFGFTPLFIDAGGVDKTVTVIAEVMQEPPLG
jgi:kynureninase